jgi:hypothetical protein
MCASTAGQCGVSGVCERRACASNDATLECSGNGVCCDGRCRCARGFVGAACDVPPPTTLAPTTIEPDPFTNDEAEMTGLFEPTPTPLEVRDLCPNTTHKLTPGLCGCDVGDEDGDGIEDCLESFWHVDAYDWARNIDIYENSPKNAQLLLSMTSNNNASSSSALESGRLVARLGIPPLALSKLAFERSVVLSAAFDVAGNVSAVLPDATVPQQVSTCNAKSIELFCVVLLLLCVFFSVFVFFYSNVSI